jgi:hypothetical protein
MFRKMFSFCVYLLLDVDLRKLLAVLGWQNLGEMKSWEF